LPKYDDKSAAVSPDEIPARTVPKLQKNVLAKAAEYAFQVKPFFASTAFSDY